MVLRNIRLSYGMFSASEMTGRSFRCVMMNDTVHYAATSLRMTGPICDGSSVHLKHETPNYGMRHTG